MIERKANSRFDKFEIWQDFVWQGSCNDFSCLICSTVSTKKTKSNIPTRSLKNLSLTDKTSSCSNILFAILIKIAALMEDVQRLQATLSQTRESNASQIRLLEQQLDSKQEMITRLEAILDTQRDYEELKRQLTIIKMTSSNDSISNPDMEKTTKGKRLFS
jgi:TolA-binding protein